jgi:ribose 5-phosphate isomerase B
MKIAIGCDQNAYLLKEDIKAYLTEQGHEIVDFGCHSSEVAIDYPDVAVELSTSIAQGEIKRGILLCGTGIGMAIVANKVRGVRAACCHDPYSAERARKSNNAQVLTMGSQIVPPKLARILIDHWLASEFDGGASARKVEKIEALDKINSISNGVPVK